MAAGVLVGATVFPARLKGLNEKLTLAATGLLIFSMGVLLAGRDSFLEELGQVRRAGMCLRRRMMPRAARMRAARPS